MKKRNEGYMKKDLKGNKVTLISSLVSILIYYMTSSHTNQQLLTARTTKESP